MMRDLSIDFVWSNSLDIPRKQASHRTGLRSIEAGQPLVVSKTQAL